MSWRTSEPRDVVDDVDSLTEASIEAAADFLSDHGSFRPFMLTIDLAGERSLRTLGVVVDEPTDARIVAALTFPDDAATLRARATVLDVSVREPFRGDAIKAKVEHRSRFCSDLLVPYTQTDDELRIDMTRADAVVAVPHLWGQAGEAPPGDIPLRL